MSTTPAPLPIDMGTNFHVSEVNFFRLAWRWVKWKHLLSALYPKVIVLFNINFAPPSLQIRHIQWGRTNIRFFFFLKKLNGYYSVANHADLSTRVRIFENVQICADFKDFSYFCLWKNRNKMRVYERKKFFLHFPHIFSKTNISLYFYKFCTNLWKFVIIVFNSYMNFIRLSHTSTIVWKASIKFE